ncbi:hypothetical protein BSLG_005537 [Batrachochytrium salamandrivorans]|nr:hypothetical protein BSLG_005537 [Batrachochytrium salamandrivorans]
MAEEDADGLFRRHSVGELKLMLGKIKQRAVQRCHRRCRCHLANERSFQKWAIFCEATDSLCDVSALKSSHSRAAGSDHSADDERKRLLFSVAAQIRLLVITPEQANLDHIGGASISCCGKTVSHISIGIFWTSDWPSGSLIKIPSSFPVVQRQWDAISPFKVQIIEKSTSRLRNISLNDQQISEILGAIAMLDNISPKETLKVFLAQRAISIEHRFSPVMNLDSNTVNLCNESVQSSTQQWLHTITRMIQTEGSSVLSSISSGVSLVAIRSRTLEYIHVIQTQTPFAFETSSALVPPPTSTGLHDTSWEKLVRGFCPCLPFRYGPIYRDVASFVWNTGVSEIHERNISYSNIKAVCRMQTPSIKELGEEFESAVMLVRLDVLPLIEMQTAYSSYPLSGRDSSALSIGVSAKAGIDSLDMQKDTKALSLTFRDSFFTAIKAYRDGMLAQLNEISSRIREEEMTEHVFGIDHSLFIGRTARIISLKVGKLISDYESRPMYRQGLGSGGRWISPSAAQQFLNHRTSHLLSSSVCFTAGTSYGSIQPSPWYLDLLCRSSSRGDASFPAENHDWKHGEQFQIVWESVAIQAQGETGNTMESKISLPVHVSSFVLNLLLDVCAELNRIGSYTLEKPCLKQLLLEISSRIIGVYSTFVNSDIHGKTISEKGAFQLLFDFLLLVKKPRAKASAVTAAIKLKIDPIDLAIVEGQIVSNVERFYSRAWVILGSLLLLNPRPYGQNYPNSGHLLLHDPMQGYIASSKSRSSSSLTDVSKTDGTPKDTSKPAMDTASAHALSKRRTRPKVILCLSKTTHGSSSNDRLPSLASAMDSQAGSSTGGAGSSGGRVMGLVNAVAGNISLSSSQQQKATELLMNASSFISGVWGTSSPSANISVGSGGDSAGTLKRQVNK